MNQYSNKEKNISPPDYDLMWTTIEKEAHKRRVNLNSSQKSAGYRAKAIPISIIFTFFLLVAIPVFASMTIDWDRIGGRGVASAINNGIGQQYDLQSASSGVTMNLNGVVTDGEKMKMLISLDTSTDLSPYSEFATEENTIIGESDARANVYGYLGRDPDTQKLIGIYETADTLKGGTKEFTFEAKNLILYRDRDIFLKSNQHTGESMVTGVSQFPAIHIESVRHADNQTVIRYKVEVVSSDLESVNPRLRVHTGAQVVDAIPTILPSEEKGLLIEQVFDISEADWANANLHFSYVEAAKRLTGTWKFDFVANGKKASEAIYTKKLYTNPEFQAKTGVTLDQLVITPLNLQILIDEEGSYTEGIVQYKSIQMIIDDKTITGVQTTKGGRSENNQQLFHFESPEWYQNWSDVPMKLILKDAIVEKRDTTKNWIHLNEPAKQKQYTKLTVDGLEIQFSYYKDGEKLIVESYSKTPSFRGVNQTMLRINGKEVVPEINPQGMTPVKIHIDTYKDIPFDGHIELNPGIYKYSDPDKNVEIQL
ncbi:DUF4179 domain-containing protein [Paenibacillus xylanexedens]|uniref:RNA polymerase subunit sigma n=1 Tax=Paenibacillus xylanexedens TaxID=528191 RepID=A0ABS4RVF5_PAEXY|nr:DUF4179 domain-containing protein [Paenibacillus xylanexedens]MBP2246709.1 hypothetical protein [Paenibacillus xylanexedens]